MSLRLGILLISALLSPFAGASDDVFVVDNFDDDVQNKLGGYRNAFRSAPSKASIIRDATVHRGPAGRCLRVTAVKGESGFCGAWIHFFDMKVSNPEYFDSSEYNYLSFWVKGKNGNEGFNVRVADKNWIKREDSVKIAHVDSLLPDHITTEWQEVIVPLNPRRGLVRSQLGGITIEFVKPGDHTVYIDDLSFKRLPNHKVPNSKANKGIQPSGKKNKRAMWVWNSRSLLYDSSWRNELIQFCSKNEIDVLWVQVEYSKRNPVNASSKANHVRCDLDRPDQLRSFLKAAHDQSIEVHALDGDPSYCRKQFHHIPLSVVDAVLAFNDASEEGERFDGIHLDNEPYLLPHWRDAESRQLLLREYLELNVECQRRVRAQEGMQFGVDVPFWWHHRDEQTGKSQAEVSFNGKTQPASFHCIELLDNVGVMNYRDVADGADGMISIGRGLLRFADQARHAKLFMGVETFAHRPIQVWFCVGVKKSLFHDSVLKNNAELFRNRRINGRRIRTFDDGERVHVGLELPDKLDAELREQLVNTMRTLTLQITRDEKDPNRDAVELLQHVQKAVASRPQWQNFRRREIDGVKGRAELVTGFMADYVMLPKVTFSDDTFEDFQEQTIAADQYFRRFGCYRGLAIHYYGTFRELHKRE